MENHKGDNQNLSYYNVCLTPIETDSLLSVSFANLRGSKQTEKNVKLIQFFPGQHVSVGF